MKPCRRLLQLRKAAARAKLAEARRAARAEARAREREREARKAGRLARLADEARAKEVAAYQARRARWQDWLDRVARAKAEAIIRATMLEPGIADVPEVRRLCKPWPDLSAILAARREVARRIERGERRAMMATICRSGMAGYYQACVMVQDSAKRRRQWCKARVADISGTVDIPPPTL